MFEKEDFEKYMKDSEDYYDNREPITERKLYQLWKDGAEFGYNKANEWHYVKDGDLPGCDKLVLFATDVEIYLGKIDQSKKIWWTGFCMDNSISSGFVVAWKEIVLPKE